MLWIVLIASIIGLLAVEPIAQQIDINQLSYYPNVNLILWLILAVLLGFYVYQFVWKNTHNNRQIQSISIFELCFKFIFTVFLFLLTLLTTLSQGLKDYQIYQQSLLKQPLNITATIQSHQISDSFNQTTSRQVWKILQLDKSHLDKLNSPVTVNGMNVLVTANLQENPDWQPILTALQPSQTLQVQLQLTPINQHFSVNVTKNQPTLPSFAQSFDMGFDEKLWLRQRDIQAKAELVAIVSEITEANVPTNIGEKLRFGIEKLRWQLRQNMLNHFHHANFNNANRIDEKILTKSGDSHAVLLGLLTGDRAMLTSDIKNLYQLAGISHLLAISGPHVLMLASVVSLWTLIFVQIFVPKLLVRLPSHLLVLWVSVVVAGVYALIVGFELPAQRTFWLLLLLTLSQQWLWVKRPYQLLAVVALLMMWADSTAVLQAGFWLSFVAVGLLMKFSEQIGKPNIQAIVNSSARWQLEMPLPQRILTRLCQESWVLFKLQLWLFVLMMPIVVWFFGKVSLIGILLNVIAVPLLGLIIVPLDMLAGILSLFPFGTTLADWLWSLLVMLLNIFHQFLKAVTNLKFGQLWFVYLDKSQLILGLLAVLCVVLGRIVPRWWALPLVLATMLLNLQKNQDNLTNAKLIILDNPTVNVQLLLLNGENWLLLSDNRSYVFDKSKKPFEQQQAEQQKSLSKNEQQVASLLNNDIYPLLAKYQLSRLTGVIGQTPSSFSNDVVQALAKTMPIRQYYLAGFDATKPSDNQFVNISPKACQAGTLLADNDKFRFSVLTGWQLKLNNQQMSEKERNILHSCFLHLEVHIEAKNLADKSWLIASGNSPLPWQMLQQLYPNCPAKPNRWVVPYGLLWDKTWLQQAMPSLIHVITGQASYQKINENNHFALALLEQNQANKIKQNLQIVQSDQMGQVEYRLD